MVSLEKIVRLADESQFDSTGSQNTGIQNIDLNKVKALGEGTKHDICASTASKRQVPGAPGRIGEVLRAGICHAFTPDGRCVSLFKTLFTNSCIHDCKYCPNSTSSKGVKNFAYTPDELARITLNLYRGNYVEGLFLSSGVGGDETKVMENMLDSVRILREKHNFQGYIHLKVLPGSSYEHIKQAIELVDRVSLNVESPSKSYLGEMSSTKGFDNDIIQRQKYIRDIMKKTDLGAGHTTQFVVGAADETDREIFTRMLYEYNVLDLKRSYFSAFASVNGTAFEGRRGQPRWRENRLYQVDWLHRVYEFGRKEIGLAFDDAGFLQDRDPKWNIAAKTFDSPLDPNEATKEELLRVPGIGPISARRILKLRERDKIIKCEQLARLGVRMNRARTFLELDGWKYTKLDRWA